MLGRERFSMLGRDLHGVDMCSDIFLNFLNSNHMSLSGADTRFATLAWFCHADTVSHAWHGFVSVVFLSYLNSNRQSLFQVRARVFQAAMVCHADTVCHAWQGTVLPCLAGNGC